MKKFLIALLVVGNLFFASVANAEIKTYTGTDDYTVGERETQEDAQNHSKLRALRNAQEQAGFFISTRSHALNLKLIEDDIVVIAQSIMKVIGAPQYRKEILSDGKSVLIHTTITVQIDTDELDRRLDEIVRQQKPSPPPIEQPKPVEEIKSPAPQPPEQSVEKIEQPVPPALQPPVKTKFPKTISNTNQPAPSIEKDNVALAKQKYKEADKLYDAGKYNEAISLYDEAIKLNPKVDYFYNDRGIAYKCLKKYDKALENYNKATEINPNYKFPYNNRGVIYREQKKYKQALVELDKAIELDPNFATAYANRGWTYYAMDKSDKALVDYAKAIELNPKVAWFWNNRGVVYHNLKGYIRDAIKNYDKAIELAPNDGLYYRNRGRCYRQLGESEKAKADLKRAKELGFPD